MLRPDQRDCATAFRRLDETMPSGRRITQPSGHLKTVGKTAMRNRSHRKDVFQIPEGSRSCFDIHKTWSLPGTLNSMSTIRDLWLLDISR